MTDRATTIPLPEVPRRPDGLVDADALCAAMRRRGRVHRLESAAGTPGGTGRSVLVPASGRTDRVTAGTFARLDAVVGPVDADEDARRPGHARVVGGHVVAVPYDLGTRPGATAFLEAVEVAVTVEDGRAWVTGPADDVQGLADDLARTATVPARPTIPRPGPVAESLGRARFESAVGAILERIAAGDVYVVNLTQQLTATFDGDVHELYRSLRAVSPAPHGAVIELSPGAGLASVSPEAFLDADGRQLAVRPIKGTRPRHDDPDRDARAAEELRTSEKERAENVMVVDLERNDLGRICETGSVTVPELFAVEGHPTVWQLVSTIRGRLRGDLGYAAALSACFPSGSVTGAPKIAAMGIIDELEPVPRGWYCGIVGWIGPGVMRTAVTIRTAVLRSDGTVSYGTGSGIVADSDPAAEYEEARLKAAPFLRATGTSWPDARPVRDERRGG